MTYKELLTELQKLDPTHLQDKAEVLDTKTNKYYPITSFYHKAFSSGFCTQVYTFIEFRSKK